MISINRVVELQNKPFRPMPSIRFIFRLLVSSLAYLLTFKIDKYIKNVECLTSHTPHYFTHYIICVNKPFIGIWPYPSVPPIYINPSGRTRYTLPYQKTLSFPPIRRANQKTENYWCCYFLFHLQSPLMVRSE